jgi:hypothetical protein
MNPIAHGDGYLQDVHQRPEVRRAQQWLNEVARALPALEGAPPLIDDGMFGNGSQARLDTIRDVLGCDGSRGMPLTEETVYIIGAITGIQWDLNREEAAGLGTVTGSPTGQGLRVVTREEWGARAYRGTPARLGRVKGVVIHHTAGHGFPQTLDEGKREVRAVQRLHQLSNGWADVGYHLLLGQDGTWYQGRPWLGADAFDEAVRESAWSLGSHVGGKNTGRIGLSVMGWFHAPKNHRMSAEARASLRAMVHTLMGAYDLAPSALTGHRQLGSTACPGDLLYPIVQEIREEL